MTKDGTMVTNDFRDLWFIVGINVISECCTGFRNSGCLLYELLKTEEGGNTTPSGRLFEEISVESPISKMLALLSVTLSIMFINSSGHS